MDGLAEFMAGRYLSGEQVYASVLDDVDELRIIFSIPVDYQKPMAN